MRTKGNLQIQLIHHGATDLAISANHEVAFPLFEADFVHYGFPNLRSMPAEDRDRYPLRNPYLKGKTPIKTNRVKNLVELCTVW
jgi:hypothetical protein